MWIYELMYLIGKKHIRDNFAKKVVQANWNFQKKIGDRRNCIIDVHVYLEIGDLD